MRGRFTPFRCPAAQLSFDLLLCICCTDAFCRRRLLLQQGIGNAQALLWCGHSWSHFGIVTNLLAPLHYLFIQDSSNVVASLDHKVPHFWSKHLACECLPSPVLNSTLSVSKEHISVPVPPRPTLATVVEQRHIQPREHRLESWYVMILVIYLRFQNSWGPEAVSFCQVSSNGSREMFLALHELCRLCTFILNVLNVLNVLN